MTRTDRADSMAAVTQWITHAAALHGHELPQYLMQHLGISRRRAGVLVAQLVESQWLRNDGTARKPLHRPGTLRQRVQSYALAGLEEDLPWRRDFAPFFDLPTEVRRMAQHAFTELLNNAVDHSGGSTVTVSMRQTPLHLQMLVSDNGCGLFERIAQSFDIADPQMAMFELSKGKLTSLPDRHCGHGLFFASRLADVFDIHANRAAFQHRAWSPNAWRGTKPAPHPGTSIYLAIALDTTRTLESVLKAQSRDASSHGFDRTQVPLRLLAGADLLVSRADARRVAARLEAFEQAEIDFSGIEAVGHGFADELFRVFRGRHPGVALQPLGMAPAVSSMVRSVMAA